MVGGVVIAIYRAEKAPNPDARLKTERGGLRSLPSYFFG
jgi:hypothetical protein